MLDNLTQHQKNVWTDIILNLCAKLDERTPEQVWLDFCAWQPKDDEDFEIGMMEIDI